MVCRDAYPHVTSLAQVKEVEEGEGEVDAEAEEAVHVVVLVEVQAKCLREEAIPFHNLALHLPQPPLRYPQLVSGPATGSIQP